MTPRAVKTCFAPITWSISANRWLNMQELHNYHKWLDGCRQSTSAQHHFTNKYAIIPLKVALLFSDAKLLTKSPGTLKGGALKKAFLEVMLS